MAGGAARGSWGEPMDAEDAGRNLGVADGFFGRAGLYGEGRSTSLHRGDWVTVG